MCRLTVHSPLLEQEAKTESHRQKREGAQFTLVFILLKVTPEWAGNLKATGLKDFLQHSDIHNVGCKTEIFHFLVNYILEIMS